MREWIIGVSVLSYLHGPVTHEYCVYVRVCVCERDITERNEGHPDDLDSCTWRRLMEDCQHWCLLFCLFYLRVYVWRIPPQLDQFSHWWTNTGQASAPSYPPAPFPPLLVYLLIWLPGHFPTCPANTNRLSSCGLGVNLLSFGVSYSGWTRTSLEYFHSLYGCWVSHMFLSLRFDSDKITKWPAPLHFLAVLWISPPAVHCSNLQGVI